MQKIFRLIWTLALLGLAGVSAVSAQVAAGGSYTLAQTVVAGGGGTSTGGAYKIEGTGGQTVAGGPATAGAYTIRDGFWVPGPLAPTAAGASLGGRVVGTGGEPLRNVIVTVTGGNLFTPRTARTGTFGNFAFENLPVGAVYTITVQNRRYGFPQPTQLVSLLDNVSDIVFQAGWEN